MQFEDRDDLCKRVEQEVAKLKGIAQRIGAFRDSRVAVAKSVRISSSAAICFSGFVEENDGRCTLTLSSSIRREIGIIRQMVWPSLMTWPDSFDNCISCVSERERERERDTYKHACTHKNIQHTCIHAHKCVYYMHAHMNAQHVYTYMHACMLCTHAHIHRIRAYMSTCAQIRILHACIHAHVKGRYKHMIHAHACKSTLTVCPLHIPTSMH
jgi:hypothetical protein